MKRVALCFLGILLLGGCGRLEAIPYQPQQRPESWLASQPFVHLSVGSADWILVQPSSTVLVYALGLVAIGAALRFWRIQRGQRSRAWWGVALLLWGLGALCAGTSYQAFSYEIKCAGREFCAWTSGWEVAYLMLSAASVDAMVLAGSRCCAAGRRRKAMAAYAVGNAALYGLALLVGTLVPVRFLVSFELLLLAAAPGILFLFVLNATRAWRHRDPMDLTLAGAWLGLGATLGAYFLYLASGLTDRLWEQGIWFSENDVLHIGLIVWMVYLAVVVAPRLLDAPPVDRRP